MDPAHLLAALRLYSAILVVVGVALGWGIAELVRWVF
jgi:hypothetical protein